MADNIKIHLIVKGCLLCNTVTRFFGVQAVTSLKEFRCLSNEDQCVKCNTVLRKMGK